ncbi:MAG: DUF1501 domain-containing protein [Planctomycetaceae bacterium]
MSNTGPDPFGLLNRRRWLQIGALAPLGLDAFALASLRQQSQAKPRANACVFIFLFGGPSHIDLWDMKPDAPREIRGEFRPVATNATGIQICEHLPLSARQMDKLCLLRSMTHQMRVHGPACSEIYSGREYFGPPVTDQATPRDWPSLASLVTRFGDAPAGLPRSVVLPWYTQFVGQDRRIAGQTGGRMGEEFNPFLMQGNPKQHRFRVSGLQRPQEVSAKRFQRRRRLLQQLEANGRRHRPGGSKPLRQLNQHYRTASSLIERGRLARALKLNAEPARNRDAYGRTRFGQSLLLSRRLVEAGVPLVTVNWDDDHKSDKVSPHWDTHVDNFPKLKDRLCPPFDRALSAFLADLHDRGLLETTLVVALGEFGRTPKVGTISQNNMTKPTGRDHWPHAFTTLLAGGGVRGGQVYGETVASGGYVKDKPVSPADLSTTILHHLGVDPRTEYEDRFLQVRQRLSIGRRIDGLA